MMNQLKFTKQNSLPAVGLIFERIEKCDPRELTDVELLEVILGDGKSPPDVRTETAAKFIAKYGFVSRVGGVADVAEMAGVPRAVGCRIIAAMEFGRRRYAPESLDFPIIRGPEDVYRVFEHMQGYKRETLEAAYLDTRNKVIHRDIIAVGTLGEVPVDPAEVFEPAVGLRAAAVIVAHNHPTGNSEPSPEDRKVTEELRRAGEIMKRPLLDHLVIGAGSFRSIMHDTIRASTENPDARDAVQQTLVAHERSLVLHPTPGESRFPGRQYR